VTYQQNGLVFTKYGPAGERHAGRPLKSLLDRFSENGKGREAEVLERVMMMMMTMTI
jgi:hypothetical protein